MYRIQNDQSNYDEKFSNVAADQLKSQLIDYIYNIIDLGRFKFLNLEGENQLLQLLLQKYFISANFSGVSCLLVFAKIKDKYYSFLVERKTLSYVAEKVVIKNVKLTHVHLKLDPEIYKGTIFDGIFIQGKTKKTFVITDVFAFKGSRTTDSKLDSKLLTTLTYLKSNYDETDKDNSITLAINKLYPMETEDDIKHLVNNVIPKIKDFNIRGLCFFPEKSGTKLIFLFGNENKMFTPKETNMITQSNAQKQLQNHKTSTSNDESGSGDEKVIGEIPVAPVIKRPIKTLYIPKNGTYDKSYIFEMKKSDKVDVYTLNIVEPVLRDGKKHLKRKQVGLAFIPNMARSKWCKEIMNESNNNILVNCKYHKDKKKWEPIEQSDEKKPSLVDDFQTEQVEE